MLSKIFLSVPRTALFIVAITAFTASICNMYFQAATKLWMIGVKCHRLFRPQFRKVKTSFVVEIREVSNTLTLNAGVSGDTLV